MKFHLLVLIMMISTARADWHIGEVKLELSPCPEKNCTISSHCLKQGSTCEALQASKNRRKGKVGPGGTNPGSAVCQNDFGGKVNLAMDSEGNTIALCQFKDGSLLSLNGLWIFGP